MVVLSFDAVPLFKKGTEGLYVYHISLLQFRNSSCFDPNIPFCIPMFCVRKRRFSEGFPVDVINQIRIENFHAFSQGVIMEVPICAEFPQGLVKVVAIETLIKTDLEARADIVNKVRSFSCINCDLEYNMYHESVFLKFTCPVKDDQDVVKFLSNAEEARLKSQVDLTQFLEKNRHYLLSCLYFMAGPNLYRKLAPDIMHR